MQDYFEEFGDVRDAIAREAKDLLVPVIVLDATPVASLQESCPGCGACATLKRFGNALCTLPDWFAGVAQLQSRWRPTTRCRCKSGLPLFPSLSRAAPP